MKRAINVCSDAMSKCQDLIDRTLGHRRRNVIKSHRTIKSEVDLPVDQVLECNSRYSCLSIVQAAAIYLAAQLRQLASMVP
jgi:hypothetical protein